MQYEIKDNKVIVDKDSFNEESEIQYLNFVLGYDLLNNFYIIKITTSYFY